jgi:hypothetical protein
MHAAQPSGHYFQHNHPADHLIGQQPYRQMYTPQQTPGANISTRNNQQAEAQNYYQQYNIPQNGQQQNGDQQQQLIRELNNMRQDATDMFAEGGSYESAQFETPTSSNITAAGGGSYEDAQVDASTSFTFAADAEPGSLAITPFYERPSLTAIKVITTGTLPVFGKPPHRKFTRTMVKPKVIPSSTPRYTVSC